MFIFSLTQQHLVQIFLFISKDNAIQSYSEVDQFWFYCDYRRLVFDAIDQGSLKWSALTFKNQWDYLRGSLNGPQY